MALPTTNTTVFLPDKPIFTVREAAEVLRVKMVDVDHYLSSGQLPFFRVAGDSDNRKGRRILRSEIAAMCQRNEVKVLYEKDLKGDPAKTIGKVVGVTGDRAEMLADGLQAIGRASRPPEATYGSDGGAITSQVKRTPEGRTEVSTEGTSYRTKTTFEGLVEASREIALAQQQAVALVDAINAGGYDLTICGVCGITIVAIPDGMPSCEECAVRGGS